jgi:hypothetical protein
MVLGDAKVMGRWQGIGDDDSDDSDHQRACDALAARDFAMIDVGRDSAVVLTLAIGQGIVRVFRVGPRLVLVETLTSNKDELFLEFVASEPSRTRSVANLAIPSGKLSIVPTTEPGNGDEALIVDVPSKVAITIEPESKGAWGVGRRCFVAPA